MQISLFFFALKPFHYGTWYQVEPTVLALFILAAANAAWLAVGFFMHWLELRKPLHPLLLCLVIWVFWQWLATWHAFSPWRSWFGPPGIGEGTGFYTAMLLCYLLAWPLWKDTQYQKIIMAVAAFDLLAMSWLHFNPSTLCPLYVQPQNDDLGMPGNWTDYLPFLVAYVWIALLATPKLRTPSRYAWLVIASTLIVFHVAQSFAASLLFKPPLIIGGLILWVHVVWKPKWLKPNRFWKIAAILCCFVPFSWLIISESPKWSAMAACSLPTRALFNQASLTLLAHEPGRLLMGDGWGRFIDDLFKYTLVDGIRAFYQGQFKPNWFVLGGYAYHSHDEIIETILSLGLPGMLLWLLLPIIAIWTMPSRIFWWCMPMLLAVFSLQSFWFFLPQVLAYQALMWVALSSRWYPKRGSIPLPGRWLGAICICMTIAMIWSATAQWKAMQYGEVLSHAITDDTVQDYSVQWLDQDIRRGGDRFYGAAHFYGKWAAERATDHAVSDRDVSWYRLMLEASQQAALSPQSGPVLASADIYLLNLLFTNVAESKFDALKPEVKSMLPEAALCISEKAPLREDMTASFLYSLDGFTGGDAQKSMAILQQILAVAPNHRGALWVMGQELAKMPGHEAEGRRMMKRAVNLGLVRVFPATAQEISTHVGNDFP